MSAVDTASREITPVALPGLGRALILAGKLGQKSAEEIYRKASSGRTSFIAELTGSGAVSASDLAHTMSSAYAAPLVDLDAIDQQRLPKGLLDPKICQAYRVVVLSKRSNRLTVATADPSDQEAIEKIKFATQLGVDWVIAEYDKVLKLVDENAASATETMEEIIGGEFEFDEAAADGVSDNEQTAISEVDDAPVVKFLHKMLLDAFSMRASDLHFEPYEHTYRVRFRIDGELREIAAPPIAIKDKLASRIKVISKMDISEKRVPQDGKMKLKIGPNKVIDFRVSTLPTLFGEKIVIRILDPSSAKLGVDALGYEPEEKRRLLEAISRPYGMILVTGPTGSGKTVSLYTCLNLLNKPGVNIATAEDPSEINLPGVNQVNVNDKAGPDVCGGTEVIPAPGSGHHHGRRDPRPGNGRHCHQGRADRPPGLVYLAHQRCANHPDPHAQHGHRAVQHRVERDLDHGAASGPAAVSPMQGGGGHPGKGAARCRFQAQ